MKITHCISSIDKNSGGTTTACIDLVDKLKDSLDFVCLYAVNSTNPVKYSIKNGEVFLANPSFIGYSKELEQKLNKVCVDVFHGHGLWDLSIHQMSLIAKKRQTPYIITPHGMLEPWSLMQGKLKKKIALKWFQYKDLAKATCIHATAPSELKNIRALGFKNPIAMIPNGVNISEFPVKLPVKINKPKKILFLSRIHVKKGIENLIEAWKLIPLENRENWIVEIVGNGDDTYIQSLKNKIISEKLNEQIEIKKPVFGEDKIKLFREASLFVLPTFSENFGIVIAEALASYTPVITTKGTPWEDLEIHKCGWWIDIGVKPLKIALEEAIAFNDKTFIEMGANGRKLIEDKYSMQFVAEQMLQLYQWVLTKDNKPNFVDIL
jgi:glycosyltransferase involved in cell wall biosynthesis